MKLKQETYTDGAHGGDNLDSAAGSRHLHAADVLQPHTHIIFIIINNIHSPENLTHSLSTMTLHCHALSLHFLIS